MKKTAHHVRFTALLLAVCLLIGVFPTVAKADSFSAEVSVSRMCVRSGPSVSYGILGYLSKGTVVTVLSYADGIAKISYNGRTGYCQTNDLKKISQPAPTEKPASIGTCVITSSSAKVYASASTGASVMCTVSKGQKFEILATSGDWARLRNGNYIGYIKLSDTDWGTPASTPTPTPKPESIGTCIITSSSAKVYASASTGASVMCTVSKGQSFEVLATSGDWARLRNGSNIGYIRLSDTDWGTPQTTPTPTPTPTAKPEDEEFGLAYIKKNDTKVYKSYSTRSDVLCKVSKGTNFTILDMNDDWVKLENGKTIGYVLREDVNIVPGVTATPRVTPSPTPTAKPESIGTCVITSSSARVYASASTGASVMCTVSKGQSFEVLATSGDWARLRNGSSIGYIRLSDTDWGTPQATPTPAAVIEATVSIPAIVNCAAPVYAKADTSSTKYTTLAISTELTVLGYNSNWALIKLNSNTGYMPLSALTRVCDVTMKQTMSVAATVTASTVKCYKYATDVSTCLGSLSKGSTVTVLACDDTWAYIQKGSNIGYCAVSALSKVGGQSLTANESIASVISQKVTVYKEASASSAVLGTLTSGVEVTVLAHNSSWALIEKSGNRGYIDIGCVKRLSDVTMTANESYSATVSSNASVYEYMFTGSTCVGAANKGLTVTVLAHNTSWALIKKGSNVGYIPMSKLSLKISEFISPTIRNVNCTVTKSASVYNDASTGAGKLGTVSVGTELTATAYTSKWIRITYNGTNGYIQRNYVSAENYAPLKSGSTASSDILKLQKALEDLGYFDGLPAGNYGSITTNAVKRFQTELGLNVTGTADVNTLRVLYSSLAPASSIKSTSLAKGSVGTDVTRLQTRLMYKGYFGSTIDGDYGPLTQQAVALYQKTAGLSETGNADKATLSSLFSSSAPKCTSGTVPGGSVIDNGNASTGKYSTDPEDDTASGTASDEIETLITVALAQLGKPYIYATSGPKSFDCSGFTGYCYKQLGISLGRSAYAQGYGKGTKIEKVEDMKRGDIVCMNTISDSDLSDHVGIYLGNGKFIHASSAAEKVIISSITSGYYNRVFSWARRIL